MNDKRQALVFIGLVLIISWAYEAYIAFHGGVERFGIPGLVILMWIPGLLSILLRLILRSGFEDVRFILGKPRYYAYALFIPLALAVLTGLVCAIFDIRRFALIEPDDLRRASSVFLPILGFGLIGAFGEELGWRGFLLPKMVTGGISHPYLASGLVWACWHLPLIAFGGFYRTDDVLIMVLAYGLSIVAITFVISELRMRSQSVWVATVFHASHNFFFQLAIPALVFARPGARSDLWEIVGGDSGFTVAALYALTFLFLSRASPRNLSHEPQTRLEPESRFVVRLSESEVVCERPDGKTERVSWADLQKVEVVTTGDGPFAPDVFWVLHGTDGGCAVPQGATGDRQLLERLQTLPGFDNGSFIEAMSSTSDRRFVCWQRAI